MPTRNIPIHSWLSRCYQKPYPPAGGPKSLLIFVCLFFCSFNKSLHDGSTDEASGVVPAFVPVCQTDFGTITVLHWAVPFAIATFIHVTPQYLELGAVWCDSALAKGCFTVTTMSQKKDALLLLNNLYTDCYLGKKISFCVL